MAGSGDWLHVRCGWEWLELRGDCRKDCPSHVKGQTNADERLPAAAPFRWLQPSIMLSLWCKHRELFKKCVQFGVNESPRLHGARDDRFACSRRVPHLFAAVAIGGRRPATPSSSIDDAPGSGMPLLCHQASDQAQLDGRTVQRRGSPLRVQFAGSSAAYVDQVPEPLAPKARHTQRHAQLV